MKHSYHAPVHLRSNLSSMSASVIELELRASHMLTLILSTSIDRVVCAGELAGHAGLHMPGSAGGNVCNCIISGRPVCSRSHGDLCQRQPCVNPAHHCRRVPEASPSAQAAHRLNPLCTITSIRSRILDAHALERLHACALPRCVQLMCKSVYTCRYETYQCKKPFASEHPDCSCMWVMKV